MGSRRAFATIRALSALAIAREIAGKSPDAIRAAKRMLNKLSVDPGPALLAESVEQQKLLGSANQLEAVRANIEKRAPALCGCSYTPSHSSGAKRSNPEPSKDWIASSRVYHRAGPRDLGSSQ